jgi:hypothetical protein
MTFGVRRESQYDMRTHRGGRWGSLVSLVTNNVRNYNYLI